MPTVWLKCVAANTHTTIKLETMHKENPQAQHTADNGNATLGVVSGCGFQTHELKTWPEYWEAVKSGEKTFEVRKHDRNYKVGDWLFLACYNPKTEKYEGRGMIKCEVTYLLPGGSFGVEKGFCVMGIKVLSHCRQLNLSLINKPS